MNKFKFGSILCYVLLWCLVTRFDASHGYFEYKYYCNIQTSNRITITTKSNTPEDRTCLSYLRTLDQKINIYVQQVKIAQLSLTNQPEYSEYRNSYLDEIQPKLLQSKILQTQIIKVMNKFENDLFDKTMLYVRYRYKTTRQNLIKNLERRDKALVAAVKEGDHDAVLRINKKYRSDKRKLETINLMFESQNFNELMPFYTMLQKGEFDY